MKPYAWRGHALIIEPSQLSVRGVVLRDPLSLRTLHSHPSRRAAIQYCEREGYSHMAPVRNVDSSVLEERIAAPAED